jgi:hypothetical protein
MASPYDDVFLMVDRMLAFASSMVLGRFVDTPILPTISLTGVVDHRCA